MRVEVGILGPVEVSVSGISIVPTAGKPSQALAMLALNAGDVVTMRALIEEIWGARPPRSSVQTLQTYILKLRRMLQLAIVEHGDVSPKDILITRRSGYSLAVEPGDVDAIRYDRLSAAGRKAVNEHDYVAASSILAEALRLWRGPALVDVSAHDRVAPEWPTGPGAGGLSQATRGHGRTAWGGRRAQCGTCTRQSSPETW